MEADSSPTRHQGKVGCSLPNDSGPTVQGV